MPPLFATITCNPISEFISCFLDSAIFLYCTLIFVLFINLPTITCATFFCCRFFFTQTGKIMYGLFFLPNSSFCNVFCRIYFVALLFQLIWSLLLLQWVKNWQKVASDRWEMTGGKFFHLPWITSTAISSVDWLVALPSYFQCSLLTYLDVANFYGVLFLLD